MSLLLDALKKAADDKQKASQLDSGQVDSNLSAGDSGSKSSVDVLNESLEQEMNASQQGDSEFLSMTEVEEDTEDFNEEALTLDELEPEAGISESSNENHMPESGDVTSESAPISEDAVNDLYVARPTVSDDALSMLIYKTNREVKKTRRTFAAAVIFTSVIILIAGGVYYYIDTEEEIASLERKHNISMQSMRLKIDTKKVPNVSNIVRNDIEKESNKKITKIGSLASNNNKKVAQVKTNGMAENVRVKPSAMLSIKKTKTVDVIGEKLDTAWLLYESTQYSESASLYKEILDLEKNNRDALLGLAAISTINKNLTKAKFYYSVILEMDPRDAVANAALAGMAKDSLRGASKEQLISMLEKSPSEPSLSFALGNIYAQELDWVVAQKHYFTAWQYDNTNADYVFNLAVSLDQLKKYDEALKFYKQSLRQAESKRVSFSREAVNIRIIKLTRLNSEL